MRRTISMLVVAAALTIGPRTITAHATRCHIAACERHCWASHGYDRCMSRCMNGRYSPPPFAERHLADGYPPQRRRSSPGWQLCAQLLEVFLRYWPEILSGLLGVGVAMNRARRRHNLREAEELRSQARARRREAAALDAEADRLNHDI